jgi:hypothetical protein
MPRFATFYDGPVRLLGFTSQCQRLPLGRQTVLANVAPVGGVLGFTRFLVGFHYVLLDFNTYTVVLQT